MQQSIVNGTLLGDASIYKDGRYSFGQKAIHKGYVEFVHDAMLPLAGEITPTSKGKFVSYRFRSLKGHFDEWRARWYPNGIKIVPPDLILNWEIIAFWFADDGGNNQVNKCVLMCCESFTEIEVDGLIDQMKALDVNDLTKNKRPSGMRIRIGADSYFDFLDRVRAILHPILCLSYKTATDQVFKVTRAEYLDSVRRWDDQTLQNEIHSLITQHGRLPGGRKLRQLGRYDLEYAITKSGGFKKLRQEMKKASAISDRSL